MKNLSVRLWYMALCDFFQEHHHAPSIRELADIMNSTPHTARRALSRLERMGKIEWPRHPSGRRVGRHIAVPELGVSEETGWTLPAKGKGEPC